MVHITAAFSGISVNNLDEAKRFYTDKLGLKLTSEKMGLHFDLPGGGQCFIYEKHDHNPATYTALNFVVDDIDAAVDELTNAGVQFEKYDNEYLKTDSKGIARSATNTGPAIAWFKDPAGNILSVLQDK